MTAELTATAGLHHGDRIAYCAYLKLCAMFANACARKPPNHHHHGPYQFHCSPVPTRCRSFSINLDRIAPSDCSVQESLSVWKSDSPARSKRVLVAAAASSLVNARTPTTPAVFSSKRQRQPIKGSPRVRPSLTHH